MATWRIEGMFTHPDPATGEDIVHGARWRVTEQDRTDPDFPKFAEIAGSHAFTKRRINAPATQADNDVLAWMDDEGLNRASIAARLKSLM